MNDITEGKTSLNGLILYPSLTPSKTPTPTPPHTETPTPSITPTDPDWTETPTPTLIYTLVFEDTFNESDLNGWYDDIEDSRVFQYYFPTPPSNYEYFTHQITNFDPNESDDSPGVLFPDELTIPIKDEYSDFKITYSYYVDEAIRPGSSFFGLKFRENSQHESYSLLFDIYGNYYFSYITSSNVRYLIEEGTIKNFNKDKGSTNQNKIQIIVQDNNISFIVNEVEEKEIIIDSEVNSKVITGQGKLHFYFEISGKNNRLRVRIDDVFLEIPQSNQ